MATSFQKQNMEVFIFTTINLVLQNLVPKANFLNVTAGGAVMEINDLMGSWRKK